MHFICFVHFVGERDFWGCNDIIFGVMYFSIIFVTGKYGNKSCVICAQRKEYEVEIANI
jgi:hypothetical protein